MLRKSFLIAGLGAVAVATATLVGCNQSQNPAPQGQSPQPVAKSDAGESGKSAGGAKDEGHGHKPKDEGHGHKPGAHGGIIVSLGRDSYHAEAVFEKGGVIRLYMLGKDETMPQEVQAQDLVGYVTPAGSADATQVKFAADPQKGTAAGKTTQFAAQLPPDLRDKTLKVTINNVQVGAERFRVEFSNEKDGKGGHGH
ncbi:MAG: hypothetical protein K2X87_21930 [Gemmataceae bacterium]|nr:hypothetical protein [Gemmataceae bacterium]